MPDAKRAQTEVLYVLLFTILAVMICAGPSYTLVLALVMSDFVPPCTGDATVVRV